MRTGDTPQRERQAMLRTPPDILITTPESLFLLLTSQARELLRSVETLILDEVHAVAGTKRGAHLALSVERLERLAAGPVQRIGLSATQRPLEEIGRFVSGGRPIELVDAGSRKELDLEVVVPVEDMRELASTAGSRRRSCRRRRDGPGRRGSSRSIWPSIYPELLSLVETHRSTIVFVNNRRLAERLALRLNELAGRELARAHHGSLAREQRVEIEELLKRGGIPCLVATSSLELGIDMGAVDLVIQVESPKSVARGLQRIGRAGHELGAVSKGRIFPKFRADLLESAVVAERMREGAIEETVIPRNPLDVLAQQVVAICADEEISVDDLYELVRGAYPFADLSRVQLENVLDMLAGRYPSDEFAELRPRIVWDRTARRRARPPRRAPARGHERGHDPRPRPLRRLPRRGRRARRRAGRGDGLRGARGADVPARRLDLADRGDHARPGARLARARRAGGVPFWKGEGIGRPYELGEAIGRASRELVALSDEQALERLTARHFLDERAAGNLITFLREQAAATGAVPSDRTVVVERFRDEIGDWRVCILTPFGARVHAPWALALAARLRDTLGLEVQSIWSDDGIALHLPDADAPPPVADLTIGPDEIEELVVQEVGQTALFGARFRENAARALLIPRRRPGQRTPLWQQRLKAQSLLQVARRYGSFPVVLETYRECLQDVFDLPALKRLLHGLQTREIDLVDVETASASPYAASLLFDYIATYMYEDDTPPAERRAQALSLDRDLLRELLGQEELRDLLDPGALADVEAQLRGAPAEPGRAARPAAPARRPARGRARPGARRAARRRAARGLGPGRRRGAPDRRRGRGPLPRRARRDAAGRPARRLPRGRPRVAARSSCSASRAGAGRSRPPRRARASAATSRPELLELERDEKLVRGELRPGGTEREWCEPDVLRRLRRASLAALRREVEPAEQAALGRFLPHWHGIDRRATLREALVPLQGLPLPVSLWESDVLPRRVPGYRPEQLDALCASGELVWVGAGLDRVAVYFRDDAPVLGRPGRRAAARRRGARAAARRARAQRRVLVRPARRGRARRRGGAACALGSRLGGRGDERRVDAAPRGSPLRGAAALASARAASRAAGLRRSPRRRAAGRRPGLAACSARAASDRRALAELLLERQGIVMRDGVRGEGIPGGYGAVYGELRALETLGACRRGYFVEGLGGAQFALPGAVERLRELRPRDGDEPEALVLAAADPAQPYGAALPWPKRSQGRAARVAGAQVVLLGGEAALFVERGGRTLVPLRDPDEAWLRPALAALVAHVRAGGAKRLAVERFDGRPVTETEVMPLLVEAGFLAGPRRAVLRP